MYKEDYDNPIENLRRFANGDKFTTILADPPWRFENRTGKMAPEHNRLLRYPTLSINEIMNIPVKEITTNPAHLYLWVPNALIKEGLEVLESWGFTYKTNLVWYKIRKDGGPDGRGVGFYFRNVTELILFGIKGNLRTLDPGRTQVNIISSRKREHSKKPDETYELIESCSPGPYLELFARGSRKNWSAWGNQAQDYKVSWDTYANHSQNNTTNKKKTIIKNPVVNHPELFPSDTIT